VTSQQTSPTRVSDVLRDLPVTTVGTVVLHGAMIVLAAPTARSGPMRPGAIVHARIVRSDPTVQHAAVTVRHQGTVRSVRIARLGRTIARRLATDRSARTVPRAVVTVRHPVIDRSVRTARLGRRIGQRPAIVRNARTVPPGSRIVRRRGIVRSARTVPHGALTARRPEIVRTAETGPTVDTPLSVVAVPTAGARAVDVSCGRAMALRPAATATRSDASAS